MPSVGDQLRTAREEQGKSLEDIGGELKIRADHVLALEEGNFDKFDAPAVSYTHLTLPTTPYV